MVGLGSDINCGNDRNDVDHVKRQQTAYPARARARRACALRALGLLLHSRKGEDFLTGQPDLFTETAVTPERKVEKSFPRWEINRHAKG